MEDQRLREVLLCMGNDLVFLMQKGLISRRFQEDSSGYIERSYKKHTGKSPEAPSKAEQSSLRASPPSLIDMDDEIFNGYHGSDSSALTIGIADGISPANTDTPHGFSCGRYDLDKHESDAAAEWLGAPSPRSVPGGFEQNTAAVKSAAMTSEFAVKATASTNRSSNSKGRRNRRARAHKRHGHQPCQGAQLPRSESQLQRSVHTSRAANSVEENGSGTPVHAMDRATDLRLRATSSNKPTSPAHPASTSRWSTDLSSSRGQRNTTCPFWLTFGCCHQTQCRFTHNIVPGRAREKLECALWRTSNGCTREDCRLEHHATAHGLQAEAPGSIR